jgi:DNA polymerase III epsilon subunit family exonuclease
MIDLSNAKFAFLDIETTGLSPWFGDRICEVAVVLTEGKRIKSTLDLLINPERELSPAATHINGLNEVVLAKSPKFEEVTAQLEDVFKEAIVVCHNTKFDIQFFDSEYRRLGRQAEFPNLIDTLLIAKQFYELPSYRLEHLAEIFDISSNIRGSRAQADALTAKNVFFAMMDELKKLDKPLDDFIGIYNSPAWPEEGVYLPVELSEAIHSGKRLFIKYVDKNGEVSQRWISEVKVLGLSDYLYLQAYCHTRKAERTFRLDRIIDVAVGIEK